MTNIELLKPSAVRQLITFSELHLPDERVKFASRRLDHAVVLFLASNQSDSHFLTALGRANARNQELFEYAISKDAVPLVTAIAAVNRSREVRTATLNYGPKWTRFGRDFEELQAVQRSIIDENKSDSHLIETALASPEASVGDYACRYASADQCRAFVASQARSEVPLVNAFARLADEPDVLDLANKVGDWNAYRQVLCAIATHTSQRSTMLEVRDRHNYKANHDDSSDLNPAGAVAKRWASDLAEVQWFFDHQQHLGTIAEYTENSAVLDAAREFFMTHEFGDAKQQLRKELADLAYALAGRLPNDVPLARNLAKWSGGAVPRLIKSTGSDDVLKEIALAQDSANSDNAKALLASTQNPEVRKIIRDADLAWRESCGFPTARSLTVNSEPDKVIAALLHNDPQIHEAAVTALLAQSAALDASRAQSTAPTGELAL